MSARNDGASAEGGGHRGQTAGGPTDGAPEGAIPIVITAAEQREMERRSLRYAGDEAEAEAGELWEWLTEVEGSGRGRGFGASEESMLFARMVDQITTLCQLLATAADRYLDNDSATAWILLEQARQQLGHAAVTVGEMDGTLPRDDEYERAANLLWLLHRDRLPEPGHAQQRVDYGDGSAEPVDPRPDTVLVLAPLQLIAHAAMRFGTVAAGPMPDGRIERMAFGEYFATVLEEAMLLFRARARQRGATGLLRGADRALDAAGVVWQAIPEAWEVFPPVGGEHGAA